MAMKIPTSKQELLDLIEQEHAELERWIAPLDEAGLSQLGVPSGWTEEATANGIAIKDVLVHLTEWEKRMLAYLELSFHGTPIADPRFSLTAPKFNRLVFETHRQHPATEILRDYRATYDHVLQTLQSLDEATLARVNEGGLISYNTYSHYRWAIKKLRPWLRKQK